MYTCCRMVPGPPWTQRAVVRGVGCGVQARLFWRQQSGNAAAGELKRKFDLCLPPPALVRAIHKPLFSSWYWGVYLYFQILDTCTLKSGAKSCHYFVDVKDLNLYLWWYNPLYYFFFLSGLLCWLLLKLSATKLLYPFNNYVYSFKVWHLGIQIVLWWLKLYLQLWSSSEEANVILQKTLYRLFA